MQALLIFVTGMCMLMSGVEGSLFSSLSDELSPPPSATHVGEFRLFSHPQLESLDEANDAEIFMSVVRSMRDYALRQDEKKKRRRWKRDEEVICYKELGCFRDSGPFDYLDMLPSAPDEIGTEFLLYGRSRPDLPQTVPYKPAPYDLKVFNSSLPTKIIIHGFGSSCNRVWAHEMRQALLTTLDCNVICVSWVKGAATPNYMRAAVNTRLVGRQVAQFINQLVNRYHSTLESVHLIGFSLGAHVSGFAGLELGGNISRITGLDPAGPLFEGYSTSARLDASDAQFVDVIHSNGDSLLKGGLGTWQQLGHVDFYPNGGRMQKGCTNLFIGAVSDLLWSGPGDGRSLCNHRRSYRFFIDSISPLCTFPAMPCENYESLLQGECFPCSGAAACGNMGYYADRSSARGKLYLVTREEEPFCANQHRVVVNGRNGPDGQTYGRVDATLISSNGINETFPLTNGDGAEISVSLVRMLVAHPAIRHVSQLQLRYTAYKGWLYNGADSWAIDKVAIVNSFGGSMSYCQRNMVLPNGKPVVLNLRPGNCRVSSFRPSASFWNNKKPPPPTLPPATLVETIPEPPPLEDLSSNHVRSFQTRFRPEQQIEPFLESDSVEPSPPLSATEETRSRPDREGDIIRVHSTAASEQDNQVFAVAVSVIDAGKPVRGPDDLGVIVVKSVSEEHAPEGADLTVANSEHQVADVEDSDEGKKAESEKATDEVEDYHGTLAQLARVTVHRDSNVTAVRRGKSVQNSGGRQALQHRHHQHHSNETERQPQQRPSHKRPQPELVHSRHRHKRPHRQQQAHVQHYQQHLPPKHPQHTPGHHASAEQHHSLRSEHDDQQHAHTSEQTPPRRPRPSAPLPAPTTEPVYYVQYLPPELFQSPTADYIPSASVLPPPVRPSPQGRANRSRSPRFGFLRHLFPSWETRDETRYIPLHERRREHLRQG